MDAHSGLNQVARLRELVKQVKQRAQSSWGYLADSVSVASDPADISSSFRADMKGLLDLPARERAKRVMFSKRRSQVTQSKASFI